MKRKLLSVGLILLFFGGILSQGITVNAHQISTINNNNNTNSSTEKSKVSVQFFSLHGVEKIEREISVQDSYRLSSVMNSSDVNAIASELMSLGLLPSSMSQDELKNLISEEYGKKAFTKYSDKLNSIVVGRSEVKQNLFCTINGEANSYFTTNYKSMSVYAVAFIPAMALILLDIFLQLTLPWYPILLTIPTFVGMLPMGILGVLGFVVWTAGLLGSELIDFMPVKLSLIQSVVMGGSHGLPLPHVNTSGVIGKWAIYNEQITLYLIGFFGVWAHIVNPHNEYTKFIGSSLYIKAEGSY